MSEGLAENIALLPSPLALLFNGLPVCPPLASADPGAALALYDLLSALDPTIAARWHWRDTRKVLRSLLIMKETGRRTSEIFKEQSAVVARPRFVVTKWAQGCLSTLHF